MAKNHGKELQTKAAQQHLSFSSYIYTFNQFVSQDGAYLTVASPKESWSIRYLSAYANRMKYMTQSLRSSVSGLWNGEKKQTIHIITVKI